MEKQIRLGWLCQGWVLHHNGNGGLHGVIFHLLDYQSPKSLEAGLNLNTDNFLKAKNPKKDERYLNLYHAAGIGYLSGEGSVVKVIW